MGIDFIRFPGKITRELLPLGTVLPLGDQLFFLETSSWYPAK